MLLPKIPRLSLLIGIANIIAVIVMLDMSFEKFSIEDRTWRKEPAPKLNRQTDTISHNSSLGRQTNSELHLCSREMSRKDPRATKFDINLQNTESARFRKDNVFVTYGNDTIFNFGASAVKATGNTSWSHVAVYGEWMKQYRNEAVSCCLIYRTINGGYCVVSGNVERQQFHFDVALESRLFFCPILRGGNLPVGASVVPLKLGCPMTSFDAYVPPFYPIKRRGGTTLGICAKVAHDSLDPELIIAWMEVYKYLGMDKVIVYIDGSLSEPARQVLKFYESTGIMETFNYFQPGQDIEKRTLRDLTRQVYTDRHTVVLDCTARLSVFTFAGIIDFDEFIVPSKGRSLKQLMLDLKKKRPRSAGFAFLSSFYVRAWGKGDNTGDTILSQYTNRTAMLETARRKHIYITERVIAGEVGTHVLKPNNGFKSYFCDEQDAILRHYRYCVPVHPMEMTGEETDCVGTGGRVLDLTMAKLAEKLQTKIRAVRKRVSEV